MATNFGLQVSRSDGRLMFDSRTWGPCVYEVFQIFALPLVVVNGFDRQAVVTYPTNVSVVLTNSTAQLGAPSAFASSLFPAISVYNGALNGESTVTFYLPDGCQDATVMVIGI